MESVDPLPSLYDVARYYEYVVSKKRNRQVSLVGHFPDYEGGKFYLVNRLTDYTREPEISAEMEETLYDTEREAYVDLGRAIVQAFIRKGLIANALQIFLPPEK